MQKEYTVSIMFSVPIITVDSAHLVYKILFKPHREHHMHMMVFLRYELNLYI